MTGLKRSSNPFLKGQRPRVYFSQLVELMRHETSTRDARAYNPDWNKDKKAA